MQLISNLDHPHQNNHTLHKSSEPIQRCVVVVEGFISHSRANGKRQGNCESQPLDEVEIGKETTCGRGAQADNNVCESISHAEP